MAKLPSTIEYRLEHNGSIDGHSFAFDRGRNTFLVSNHEFTLEDYAEYRFLDVDYKPDIVDREDIENSSAFYLNSHMVMLGSKKMHDWAAENMSPELQTEVVHTMFEVFSYLSPNDLSDIDCDGGSPGHLGFDFGIREDGAFRFQVLGSCACLEPVWPGNVVSGVEDGFSEYSEHNIDTPTQLGSIHAGLGHVAFLADGRESSQGKIF